MCPQSICTKWFLWQFQLFFSASFNLRKWSLNNFSHYKNHKLFFYWYMLLCHTDHFSVICSTFKTLVTNHPNTETFVFHLHWSNPTATSFQRRYLVMQLSVWRVFIGMRKKTGMSFFSVSYRAETKIHSALSVWPQWKTASKLNIIAGRTLIFQYSPFCKTPGYVLHIVTTEWSVNLLIEQEQSEIADPH